MIFFIIIIKTEMEVFTLSHSEIPECGQSQEVHPAVGHSSVCVHLLGPGSIVMPGRTRVTKPPNASEFLLWQATMRVQNLCLFAPFWS